MGRKKIEIRPLLDERNRNVTFLKRKAGLMKKAWELSVLCGADVSIIVFSAAGKAFEFSSKDLDPELDRYYEYEGLIERRRAEEFAAMAEAGEDDDDEDEDEGGGGGAGGAGKRRASTAKGKAGGTAETGKDKPVKSLKGKEVYKQKQLSRREILLAEKKRKRKERKEIKAHQGFIEGLISDSDDDDDRSRSGSDLAGLNYAMSLGPGASAAQNLASFPSSLPSLNLPYSQAPGSYYRSNSMQAGGSKADPSFSPAYGHTAAIPSQGINYPPNMGGLQWDPALLQRYAEFQMQQNHQRQHRLLLQRQREQLAMMGVGMGTEGERRLLDDIFGAGGASGRGGSASASGGTAAAGGPSADGGYSNGHTAHGQQQHGGGGSAGSTGAAGGSNGEFIWPTFNNTQQQSNHSNAELQQLAAQHHLLQRQQAAQQQQQGHHAAHHPTQASSTSATPDTIRQNSNSYYPEEFDFDRRTSNAGQHHLTPGGGGGGGGAMEHAQTPWFAGLGAGDGGVKHDEQQAQQYASPSEFEEMIGRKRGAEDLGSMGDKRVRAA